MSGTAKIRIPRADLDTIAETVTSVIATGLAIIANNPRRRSALFDDASFRVVSRAYAELNESRTKVVTLDSGDILTWVSPASPDEVAPEPEPAREPDRMKVAFVPTTDRVIVAAYPDATGIELGDYLALVDGDEPTTIIDPDDDTTVLGIVDSIHQTYRVCAVEGRMITARIPAEIQRVIVAKPGDRIIRVTVVEAQNGHTFRDAPR